MRHNKKFNHLGRQSAHRKAMLANMASSLVMHKRIETTVAKAKALKIYLEPVITKSKEDTTHSRRVVFAYLRDKDATTELFRNVAPKIADRPGGYLRILRTGFRLGDAAEMCIIELVDFNETYVAGAVPAKARTRRSRAAAAEGAEEGAEAPKAAAKRAPAKKPAAPKAAAVKTAAPKVSGAKKAVTKSTTTKKG
ncbi:MAG: 50S ribosomal protein L17 [Rikenellaceae bacterium]|jgi:large subunit ribosomal protein L17|nr:50S ribosomal protein L17 [Rikenellaceae bacterium]